MTVSGTANAQFSPGDLARSHQSIDGPNNCTTCHEVGKAISGQKCLTCHREIEGAITSRHGYHFAKSTQTCVRCHKEHLGRDATTFLFDKNTFDHSQTGFSLTGKHANLTCEKCHNARNINDSLTKTLLSEHPHPTYLGLRESCNGCHDNRHDDAQKERCGSCHDASTWTDIKRFDHTVTRYALRGRHLAVHCRQCHLPLALPEKNVIKSFTVENFTSCQDCHKSPHTSKLQEKTCTTCHTEEGWSKTVSNKFDHNLTGFPLSGKHSSLACAKCHKPEQGATFSSTFLLRHRACDDCHEDYHHGEFRKEYENNCSTCHTTERFSPSTFTVAMHKNSSYALTGSHVAVECQGCHPKNRRNTGQFHFEHDRCDDCHANIHDQEFSAAGFANGCATCHRTESWTAVTYDHSVTGFHLAGAHATLPCTKCHQRTSSSQNITISFKGLREPCENCHQDAHNKQFVLDGVTDCKRCHDSTKWSDMAFDHNRQSRFRLTGAHAGLQCGKCHHQEMVGAVRVVRYTPLSMECESCHAGGTLK